MSSIAYGTQQTLDTDATQFLNACKLDATHYVSVYNDNGASKLTARVGTVTGDAVSLGTAVALSASTQSNYIGCCRIDDTHFAVSFCDNDGVNYVVRCVIGEVSGDTITFGTAYTVYSSGGSAKQGSGVTCLDSTHLAVCYVKESTGLQGGAKVLVFSGTTISSAGTEVLFNDATTATNDYGSLCIDALDDTHFVIGYRDTADTSDGKCIIGVVSSGTTITFGSEYAFETGTAGRNIAVSKIDSTHFMVAWATTVGKVVVGTVASGNQISYGTPATFFNASTLGQHLCTLDSTHLIVAWKENSGSQYAKAVPLELSGTDITVGTIANYDTNEPYYLGAGSVAPLDATHFAVSWGRNSGGGYTRVGVATFATNVTVSGTVLTATFSIPAPTITAIQNVSVAPSTQILTASIPVSSVVISVSVSPSAQSAVFSIPVYDIIIADVSVSPAVQSATFSIPAYTVSAEIFVTVSPDAQVLAFTIPAYEIITSVSLTPAVQEATFSIPSYSVTGIENVSITPDTQAMTFSIPSYTPTGIRNVSVAIATQAMTFTIPAYSITAIQFVTVSPYALNLSLSIPAYTIVADFWQEKFEQPETSWSDKFGGGATSWADKY